MGIQLGSNFDVNAALPLDSRTVVADETARDAIIAGRRYEGLTVYVEADEAYYQLQGGILDDNWSVIGSGGGGADTWYLEDFSKTKALGLTTGNHVTPFDGAATVLIGLVEDEEATPISGRRSLKYTQAAGSLNDFFFMPTKDLSRKQIDNISGLISSITYDGVSNDMKAIIWDVTNDVPLTGELELIPTLNNPTRFILGNGFYIPATCTQIAVGFQVIVENIGAILEVDDIELSSDPFRSTKIRIDTDWADYAPTSQGLGTPVFTVAKWRRVGTNMELSLRVTPSSSSANEMQIGLANNETISTSDVPSAMCKGKIVRVAAITTEKYTVLATGGDGFINFGNENSSNGLTPLNANAITGANLLSIEASIPIEGWKSNLKVALTPAKSSITTTRILSVDANSSGDIAEFTFSGLIPGQEYDVSGFMRGATGAGGVSVQVRDITAGAGRILKFFDFNYETRHSEGVNFKFTAETPDLFFHINAISGGAIIDGDGTRSNSFIQLTNMTLMGLAIVPRNKVAVIEDIKAAGVDGGTFTSGAWRTRDLNNVKGDSEILELVASQFRFRVTGEYKVKASAPAMFVNRHKIKIENVTNIVDVAIGTSERTDNTINSISRSELDTVITVTDTSIFYELQHQCETSQATVGFGSDNSFGVSEVYATVTVEKLL